MEGKDHRESLQNHLDQNDENSEKRESEMNKWDFNQIAHV
jgi:hypothetical protein